MIYHLNAACGCILGNGRMRNEDNFFFDGKHLPIQNRGLKQALQMSSDSSKPQIFAVFDGMGGEKDGHEAACCASEAVFEESAVLNRLAISGREFFEAACARANSRILEMAKERRITTMGTTIAALWFCASEIVSCNVGDSKIFRIRNGQMYQISQDHTDERILAAMGIKKKPVLLQFLGMNDAELCVEPYISKGEIQDGDIYLICTDGVTDSVDADSIFKVVQSADCASQIVKEILKRVEEGYGSDNATVAAICVSL